LAEEAGGEPAAVFLSADDEMEKDNFEGAISGFKQVLKAPGSAGEERFANFRLGFLNDITGNYREADSCYNLAVKKYRGSIEALLVPEMKKFSLRRRELDAAAEKEKARAAKGRDNASTYYLIGNACIMHFDFDGAAEAYSSCITKFYGINKKRSNVSIAWCFKEKGDYPSAIEAYGKFGYIDQDHRIYGEYEEALAYIKTGDLDKAMSLISRDTKIEYSAAYKKLDEKFFTSSR
jgi:tetratricopeptide (TPR) repeat protein